MYQHKCFLQVLISWLWPYNIIYGFFSCSKLAYRLALVIWNRFCRNVIFDCVYKLEIRQKFKVVVSSNYLIIYYFKTLK